MPICGAWAEPWRTHAYFEIEELRNARPLGEPNLGYGAEAAAVARGLRIAPRVAAFLVEFVEKN